MSELTPKQARAVQALAGGAEVETAAALAGVTAQTVYRWKRQDPFQQALKQAQGELALDHLLGLTGMLRRNREILCEVRDDPEVSPAVRLRAIDMIDSSLRAWREQVDFEQRLATLEDRMNAQQN